MRILTLIIVSLLLVACGDDTSAVDASILEVGVDAAITETSTLEAAVLPEVSVDTATTDALVVDSSTVVD